MRTSRVMIIVLALLTAGMLCASPPAGASQPGHDLEGWLAEHPFVAQSIIWQDGAGCRPWREWTAQEQADLREAFAFAVWGKQPPLADPPRNIAAAGDTEWPLTALSGSDAWGLYTAHVAHGLALELTGRLPWSLTEYDATCLYHLFNSLAFFTWNESLKGYEIVPGMQCYTVPSLPGTEYDFLTRNALIGSTRRDTIARLLGWCRGNLIHFMGGYEMKNLEDQWQYRGFPPVARIIEGTLFPGQEGTPWGGMRHRTAGCHGTTGFLQSVLRAVNVPVRNEVVCDHSLPCFPSEGLALSHGDDPYNQLSRAEPPIPADELLIDRGKFQAWFGEGVSDASKAANIGRRVLELALEWLPVALLDAYRADLASGAPHGEGRVYELFRRVYSLQELEALRLWERLDEKTRSGGSSVRASISAR